MAATHHAGNATTMIGAYGAWAALLTPDQPGSYSFRRAEVTNLDAWRGKATAQLLSRLAQPDTGGAPAATLQAQYEFDGLHRRTDLATALRPAYRRHFSQASRRDGQAAGRRRPA